MMLSKQIIFIYDGECPFCNHFAQLLELKSNIKNIEIIDARNNINKLPEGYDMDINGAVLIRNGKIHTGAKAINLICKQIDNPSLGLINVLSYIFKSEKRAYSIFPYLIKARRFALRIKGSPLKITE